MIHTRIKQLRQEKNLTQDQIAEALHISQNAYSLLETGKTKIDEQRLYQLAEIFKMHPFQLLQDIDDLLSFNNKAGNDHMQILITEIKELLQSLKEQLKTKDAQIAELISAVNKLK